MSLAQLTRVAGKNYQDLIAWQCAMELVETVYRESTVIPPEERYGLTAQMRRASVSIPSNIAEGHGRLEFLAPSTVTTILKSAAEVGRLVSALCERNASTKQSKTVGGMQ